MKEWWLLKRFADKPARYVQVNHIKTIRNPKEIETFSYLKQLSLGWYGLQYMTHTMKRAGLKAHSMKTFWHIVIGKDGQLVFEKWTGRIGEIRFLRKVKI